MTVEQVFTTLQGLFTLMLVSVVFKDNPLYRFAENTYIGLFVGYGVALTYFNNVRPSITVKIMEEGKYSTIIPIILGLLIYTRYTKSYAWLSYYTLSFSMGIGTGYVLSKNFKPFFVDQVRSTFLLLWGTGDWWTTVSNWIYVIGVVTTILYFLFTLQKKGVHGKATYVGRVVMMVAFGAAFGNTVMARVSLFLGRMQFLLGDWLNLIQQ